MWALIWMVQTARTEQGMRQQRLASVKDGTFLPETRGPMIQGYVHHDREISRTQDRITRKDISRNSYKRVSSSTIIWPSPTTNNPTHSTQEHHPSGLINAQTIRLFLVSFKTPYHYQNRQNIPYHCPQRHRRHSGFLAGHSCPACLIALGASAATASALTSSSISAAVGADVACAKGVGPQPR